MSDISAISRREQFTFDAMLVLSALYQTITLNLIFYSVSSLKQQSADRKFPPPGHIILIPGLTSLCYFSLMLRALQWRSNTYQYYSFMFCTSLFVLLYFFIWSLCCLSFDLRLLITPLVSSNLFFDFLVLSDRGSNPQSITLKVSMLTTYTTDTVRLVQ